MSRYVLKLGSEMEFNANSEFEIFDAVKRYLCINSDDVGVSLQELQSKMLSWNGKDLEAGSVRSLIHNMLEKNLIANISSPHPFYNTKLISDWCKSAFNCNMTTGLMTSRQFAAIQKVAEEMREIATRSDGETITRVMDFKSDGFPYNSYYYAERFEYMSGETVPALGMLHFIFENLEAKCEESCDFFYCHEIFYPGFAPVLHKFANFWEFTLGLKMDKEFFQAGLNLFADFLQFNPSICHDLYSQYAPVTHISDHANLYFAYGSNMDMQQMRTRCPSARFIGISNIKNFEYYIDKRGVASLRPKFGATVKGILWDIRDPDDWRALDRYEGVRQDYYRRHYIVDEDLAGEQKCAVYISTTAQTGEPRPGYQEKIVDAVYNLKDLLIKEFESMEDESFVESGGSWDEFEQAMDLWVNELKNWLRA